MLRSRSVALSNILNIHIKMGKREKWTGERLQRDRSGEANIQHLPPSSILGTMLCALPMLPGCMG